MRLNDFVLAEHFNLIEFQCPCCHTVMLHPLLLRSAVRLRDVWGRAVILNSAYRCAGHNKAVGWAAESAHRKGNAIDVRIAGDATEQEEFRVMALSCGFKKALLYPRRNFAHLEI